MVLNAFCFSKTTPNFLDNSSSAADVSSAEDMARTARRAAIAETGLFLSARDRDEEDNTLRGEQDGADFGVSQR